MLAKPSNVFEVKKDKTKEFLKMFTAPKMTKEAREECKKSAKGKYINKER